MIAELVCRLLLVRPETAAIDLLIAAGLVAVALAAAALLGLPRVTAVALRPSTEPFARLRVRLRASDPDAAGHRRARAPGTTR